jgi:hypothetical protein
MTFPVDPRDRSPKGDHNRRLMLGLEREEMAAQAGVTADQLREYEFTAPDSTFDLDVAERVGAALERLEATREPLVEDGGVPGRSPPAPNP